MSIYLSFLSLVLFIIPGILPLFAIGLPSISLISNVISIGAAPEI